MSEATNTTTGGVTIRPYEAGDREAIFALAHRMTVGIAPWRDPAAFEAAAREWIEESTEKAGPDRPVYVAVEGDGRVVGFISVAPQRHFTGEEQAYIGELAVDEAAEDRGIGRALVKVAEGWARSQGYRLITLDTGSANERARRFYARLGYGEEQVKLVKDLSAAAS